jgi:hypothetical protein
MVTSRYSEEIAVLLAKSISFIRLLKLHQHLTEDELLKAMKTSQIQASSFIWITPVHFLF